MFRGAALLAAPTGFAADLTAKRAPVPGLWAEHDLFRKPVPTPDQVRGRLSGARRAPGSCSEARALVGAIPVDVLWISAGKTCPREGRRCLRSPSLPPRVPPELARASRR